MSNEPIIGTAAFYPHGNGFIRDAYIGTKPGHAIRSIICTDEEFAAVCRFLAERRAATAGQQPSEPAPTVPNFEDLED